MTHLPCYPCRRALQPPVIDGILDDPAWATAQPLFLDLSSGSGAPERPTQVRACWDQVNLYVAFICQDPDIWGNYLRRDDPIYEEEVVEVFLCPSGDLSTYFEFEVSPRNVQFDALIFNPEGNLSSSKADLSWDCLGWESAVRVEGTLADRTDIDQVWTVEMAIPFASLSGAPHLPPLPGEEWKANFYRIDQTPTPEYSAWSLTFRSPPDFHVPSRFGRLIFAL